jgi:plasmid stabilization system protein ParE
MRIVLKTAARTEMQEAARYYEDDREGLGREFLAAVDRTLDLVETAPFTGSPLRGRFRRVFLHRFPYAIVYTVEGEVVLAVAIMHLKRKPGYWEERRGRGPAQ